MSAADRRPARSTRLFAALEKGECRRVADVGRHLWQEVGVRDDEPQVRVLRRRAKPVSKRLHLRSRSTGHACCARLATTGSTALHFSHHAALKSTTTCACGRALSGRVVCAGGGAAPHRLLPSLHERLTQLCVAAHLPHAAAPAAALRCRAPVRRQRLCCADGVRGRAVKQRCRASGAHARLPHVTKHDQQRSAGTVHAVQQDC